MHDCLLWLPPTWPIIVRGLRGKLAQQQCCLPLALWACAAEEVDHWLQRPLLQDIGVQANMTQRKSGTKKGHSHTGPAQTSGRLRCRAACKQAPACCSQGEQIAICSAR